MSRRVSTLFQQAWPQTPEFDAISHAWPDHVVVEMLSLVWSGFDRMKTLHLKAVDFSQTIHQLERSLTDLHAREITLLWKAQCNGFESFLPKHEAWELASCSSPSAMPTSYDFGFELVSDPRLRWPVEAKILADDRDVSRYLDDLRNKYLTGKGAPFSRSAALIGYLRSGMPNAALSAIAASLKQELVAYVPFKARAHRTSHHRKKLGTKPTQAISDFVCHHLIAAL